MKKSLFAFAATVSEREDGAPVDYAHTRGEIEDRLASTNVMLAITVDEDEDKDFDPYNSANG